MDNPSDKPRVTRGRIILFIVVIIAAAGIPIILAIQANDRESSGAAPSTPPPSGQPAATVPSATLSEANPSTHLDPIPGCQEPDQELVDTLLGTLDASGGTAELSAAWRGETAEGEQDMAALMVRSKDGTIDQPHLVWARIDGEWQAANRATAEATSSPEADTAVAISGGVSAAINCLTAGSR